MNIKDLFEAAPAISTWYHGSKTKFEKFDLSYISREGATDQEGPGFYLTSSNEDALQYGPYVHTIKAKVAKSRLMPEKRKINPQFIRGLILKAPEVDDNLTNYAENRNTAINVAVDQIMDAYGPNDYRQALEQVWYDHYRGYEREWLSRMRSVGWDGFIVERVNGVKHFICFNPEILIVEP
jgi:hypothetical protein